MASLRGDWSRSVKVGLEEDASDDASDTECVEEASPPSSEWSMATWADAGRWTKFNVANSDAIKDGYREMTNAEDEIVRPVSEKMTIVQAMVDTELD